MPGPDGSPKQSAKSTGTAATASAKPKGPLKPKWQAPQNGAGVGEMPESELLPAEGAHGVTFRNAEEWAPVKQLTIQEHVMSVDPHVREELRSMMTAEGVGEADKEREQWNTRATTMQDLRCVDPYTFSGHYRAHVETFWRWMLLVSRGVSGKCKILSYDLQALVRHGGFSTIPLDGTLFTMDNSLILFIAFVMASFTIIFVVVKNLLDAGETIETLPLERLTANMNKVVPFVLGLYISLALQRWWAIRNEGLGVIFDAIIDLQMVVACVMHPERHKPVRTLIMKWSFASIFLLLKAVRGKANLNDMLYKGLLSEQELKALLAVEDLHGRTAILWVWVLRLCHESFSEAVGPMPYSIQCAKVAEICMSASSGFSCIDMHLRTALPFVYVHLITLLVDINTIFFIAKTAVVSAVAFNDGDFQRFGVEVVCCLMVPTLYRGLLCLSYAVFDPFGDDVLDFPVGSMMDWHASCCEAVLLAQERFPGVPDSVYAKAQTDLQAATDKTTVADPDSFETIKAKFRRIMLNCFRSGKLDMVVKKLNEEKLRQEERKEAGLPEINNAKSSTADRKSVV